jgi:AcrR family transcriptional regulator
MMMVRASQADVRQSAILQAAADLIETIGCDAVTMKSIAEITGLSRPAVYQYFASREHILGELVLNEMADLSNELDLQVAKTDDPILQLSIWVRGTLDYLISPSHKVVKEISIDSLPVDQRGMLKAMHGQFMLSLLSPLARLSPEDSQALAGFVYSSVVAAADRIAKGGDYETEAATLERFVIAGVTR